VFLGRAHRVIRGSACVRSYELVSSDGNRQQHIIGKSLLDPLTIGGCLLYPQTMKRSNLSSELCKTGQITPSSGFGRWFCYSNSCFVFFLFYLFRLNL
jgi:hypothetical protein